MPQVHSEEDNKLCIVDSEIAQLPICVFQAGSKWYMEPHTEHLILPTVSYLRDLQFCAHGDFTITRSA